MVIMNWGMCLFLRLGWTKIKKDGGMDVPWIRVVDIVKVSGMLFVHFEMEQLICGFALDSCCPEGLSSLGANELP